MKLPYLNDYFLNLKTNNYSEETLYNYKRDLKAFQNFLNTKFDKINKKTILDYKSYLTSKGLSSSSLNRMLSCLRSYLKYLIEIDYPTPISPENIKLAKIGRKHYRVSEFEEIKKLIESPSQFEKRKIISLRNRAMLEVLFSTGMRISELLNLKKDQIDSVGRIFIKGKGKKERFVYLTPRAKKYLEDYLSKRKDNLSSVFISYQNKKISASYLQERIKKYRELLRINLPISAHSIRHGFATYLAEQGASPVAIQILLGHESLNTTTRYIHASDRYAQKTHKKYHPLKV